MLKKIVLGIAFVGLIGVLIYGAVLRTNAKTSSGDGQEHGSGTGLGRGRAATAADAEVAAAAQGERRGQTTRVAREQSGGGLELGENAGAQANRVAVWQTVEGMVASVGSQAVVVDLSDGRQMLVEGQAWLYAQAQAFAPQAGDQLVLHVFEEDAELKAGQIENVSSGQAITLRLEDGQPMWSGGMQNDLRGTGNGQGQNTSQSATGNQGQGRGNGGSGQGNAAGQQAGAESQPADWLTYEGVAIAVDDSELLIEVRASELVLVEGRAWSYALQQGADVQVGQAVIAAGFVEDGEFKVGSLQNLVTGQHIAVRDANGRPLWSGGGRGSQ